MRITRTGWLGVTLVIVGLSIFGARAVWSKTRTWALVDTPISLSEHQVLTSDFKSNLKALYVIEIEVEKKNIPFETLNCLLGMENTHLENCRNVSSVVIVSWVLSSQGVTVAHGSTEDARGGDWGGDTIARQVGSFSADKGRHYTLDIKVLTDGSRLAVGNPRLKVGAHPSYYEGSAFEDVPFALAAGGLLLAGIIMFTVSSLRARQRAVPRRPNTIP
jgi:hypothetical protein